MDTAAIIIDRKVNMHFYTNTRFRIRLRTRKMISKVYVLCGDPYTITTENGIKTTTNENV